MDAANLINKANRIFKSFSPFTRQVYLRTTVNVGGDALLGRFGTVTVTDNLLNPQPFVERLGRQRVPGGHAKSETYVVADHMKVGDDYLMIVTATMVTLDQLQDPSTQFIFKDVANAEEALTVHDFESASIESTDVIYTVYLRSVRNQ